MVSKYLGYAVAALLVLLLGTGYYLKATLKDLGAAEAVAEKAQAELKHERDTLDKRAELKRTTARKTAAASKSVKEAVQKEPEWAETETPKEVQDALCAVLRCSGTDGVR